MGTGVPFYICVLCTLRQTGMRVINFNRFTRVGVCAGYVPTGHKMNSSVGAYSTQLGFASF